MEKQGVIKPGVTPPENIEEQNTHKTAAQKQADLVAELDNDFRKRAAETVYQAGK